jgi:hypothetical protein
MIEQIFEINESQLKYMNNQTQVYLCFEDYIKHFLSLIGYTNLAFFTQSSDGKEMTFWYKKVLLTSAMQKEICRLSGKKQDDFSIYDPVIKWAYSAMIGYFSFIWTKELNVGMTYQEIQRAFLSDSNNSLKNIEDNEIAERFYKILEPHIISHKSRVVNNINNERYVCPYCGSRYNYKEHTNCPSCGA